MGTRFWMLAVTGLIVSATAVAAQSGKGAAPFGAVNVPTTDADPVVDGMASDAGEWARAARRHDVFASGSTARSGFVSFQTRLFWTATSVGSGESLSYPGLTLFLAHELVGSDEVLNPLSQFREQADSDWQAYRLPVPGGEARVWVLAGPDSADDSDWLPLADGLADSPFAGGGGDGAQGLDDRGFIVRLNDDPASDAQWLPGDPEPGDAGWDWEAFHHVFARSAFGQSFQTVAGDDDADNAVDHESYEVCVQRPDWSVPETGFDPTLDGQATLAVEWADAVRMPDQYVFGTPIQTGAFFIQTLRDWTATSQLSMAMHTYAGTTLFVTHDRIGSSDPTDPLFVYQVEAEDDFSSMRVPVPGGLAEIWILAGEDAVNDVDWLLAAGNLADSSLFPEIMDPMMPTNTVDDRGFIVRLNGDPATDVHWFPGDDEPGDVGFNWAAFHHVFGRATYGQSFQVTGLDEEAAHAVDHEVYEVAVYRPDWVDVLPLAEEPFSRWWNQDDPEQPVPAWVVSNTGGDPLKPKFKKTVPRHGVSFWMRPWELSYGIGAPTGAAHLQHVLRQLDEVAAASFLEVQISMVRAQSFLIGAYDSLGGSPKEVFGNLKKAAKNLRAARKLGADPLAMLTPEMQLVTLFGDRMVADLLAIDGGADGLLLTDKALRRATKAVFVAGRFREITAGKGLKAKLVAATLKLRKLYGANQKAEAAQVVED